MGQVLGIGGVFLRAKDPAALAQLNSHTADLEAAVAELARAGITAHDRT
ncbi:hypothetical protein [Loktanella sp. 5RATIMAR09]